MFCLIITNSQKNRLSTVRKKETNKQIRSVIYCGSLSASNSKGVLSNYFSGVCMSAPYIIVTKLKRLSHSPVNSQHRAVNYFLFSFPIYLPSLAARYLLH